MCKEFGSDFHFCAEFNLDVENEYSNYNACFFANGRQSLQVLINNNNWRIIWVPEYFCYEIVDAIKETGITVKFYPDAPTLDDNTIISEIPFAVSDVLLRMNFFGLRSWRDNSKIPVPVIEDHSHDLQGDWARKSNADWVIASLRKTLPLPEGGILWSPKHNKLPDKLNSTLENDLLSYKRLSAMLMKSLYLAGSPISKSMFRQIYIETEEAFSNIEKSSISDTSFSMLKQFNLEDWYKNKNQNWTLLSTISNDNISILVPEDLNECNPFSLILQFKDITKRELFRKKLIQNEIYPAVLWSLPSTQNKNVLDISETLISIHSDARYELSEIKFLKRKLETILTEIS
jgi:hypothetical protein